MDYKSNEIVLMLDVLSYITILYNLLLLRRYILKHLGGMVVLSNFYW